ncbi:MAG TPA: aminotransferase class V-fold PLP-dependent enzyme [Turneriella sp.]|nr:aminotransferase class V-fold PLP-dependent enzyme [Turneriella sp.]
MKAKIYLDFNSTHPPNKEILHRAREFYFAHFANSSGLSLASQRVNKRIEEARESVAHDLSVLPQQVVFTSCATESNNLLIRAFHQRKRGGTFNVLTTRIEHPSVTECIKKLPNTAIHYLECNESGGISEEELDKHDLNAYDFIAMIAVQNETGVRLPYLQLFERIPQNNPPYVLVDFSQALPKLSKDAPEDLTPAIVQRLTQKNFFLTGTGHKLGAGFGAGLIVLPAMHTAWKEAGLLAGGNQEYGVRAGSHNAEAIIAFAEALHEKVQSNSYKLWKNIAHHFENRLMRILNRLDVKILPENKNNNDNRAPGTTLLLLPNTPIDFLVMALDQEGITVSTGTSCKSRSRTPSAAVLAMGLSEQKALSIVRLSYSQELKEADMEYTATTFEKILTAMKDSY